MDDPMARLVERLGAVDTNKGVILWSRVTALIPAARPTATCQINLYKKHQVLCNYIAEQSTINKAIFGEQFRVSSKIRVVGFEYRVVENTSFKPLDVELI